MKDLKTLENILEHVEVLEILGNPGIPVSDIQMDSRQVGPGHVFVALKGTRSDGHDFILQAVQNGASVIICENIPEEASNLVVWVRVASTPEALGKVSSSFFNHPSERFTLVGVTGTNGKTSIATFLYRLFEAHGIPSGLISTIQVCIHGREKDTTHTTPDVVTLNRIMKEMVDAGCSHVFMEVSSHAIHQKRIAGLKFNGAIFTNLSHDHLDYHGTFKEYLKTKKRFFDGLSEDAFALVNIDDRNGAVMVQNTRARVIPYAVRKMAEYRAGIVERNLEGTQIRIGEQEVWIPFVGDFNVYNILAVYATADLLGLDREEALKTISLLKPVPGRFEGIHSARGALAIVDYAHTPDALLNVLKSVRPMRLARRKVITVVGAGGNRDRSKRPVMAMIATQYSDQVILTSDNPRNEDPEDIIRDMLGGVPEEARDRVIQIINRKEAIRTACLLAGSSDIILVAGKGHETYQEIAGVRHHFDDREVIREIFAQQNHSITKR
jgi:UDP-N-acetylmuramoyl-L-alanyl-D-glutamate--2,6-diaminopimelate ligase